VTSPDAGPLSRRIKRGWMVEVLVGGGIYFLYDWLREQVTGNGADAYRHAVQIVDAEKFLGLYHEYSIQQAFIGLDWFMAFWNIWYGTIHFVIPLVVLVWLYRKLPARYVRWRNTLVLMLGASILAFWAYPLMPPRLMPTRYGFVDTAAEFFNFGPQDRELGKGGHGRRVFGAPAPNPTPLPHPRGCPLLDWRKWRAHPWAATSTASGPRAPSPTSVTVSCSPPCRYWRCRSRTIPPPSRP